MIELCNRLTTFTERDKVESVLLLQCEKRPCHVKTPKYIYIVRARVIALITDHRLQKCTASCHITTAMAHSSFSFSLCLVFPIEIHQRLEMLAACSLENRYDILFSTCPAWAINTKPDQIQFHGDIPKREIKKFCVISLNWLLPSPHCFSVTLICI